MKYYKNNDEVVVGYVNQSSEDGKNPKGTIFFENDVIYSYGHHFPMGVRTKEGKYIINGDKYSSTTSQHQHTLFRAIPNSERVEIPYSAIAGMLGYWNGRYSTKMVEEIADMLIVDYRLDEWRDTGRDDKDGNRIYEHILGAALIEYKGEKYLSSIDKSGVGQGLYFLTQLIDNDVETIEDAFENMIPSQVKGKEVFRQGEWFFAKVSEVLMYEEIEIVSEYMLKHGEAKRQGRHYATKGFELNGKQFVQGVIRHTGGEHRNLKLYEPGCKANKRCWFEAWESPQKQSWSASGNVD